MRRAKQQSITPAISPDAPTMRDDKKLSRGEAIANSSEHPCLKRFVLVFGCRPRCQTFANDQRRQTRKEKLRNS